MSSRSSQRSSISPFLSRKSAPPPAKPGSRPTTPSSTASARPTTPSSGRPKTPYSSSTARPPPTASKTSPLIPSPSPSLPKAKENVTVTVRFRPLSAREVNKGDEIAWYADGEGTVRNEFNSSIAYGFDRVFGPATTTRHVYDVAAQHVVSGAMQGINAFSNVPNLIFTQERYSWKHKGRTVGSGMQIGCNGVRVYSKICTVFAYGVTSSGKTHTMHGEQKSPGIIPMAVKDVFSIIQETPGRGFLLRISYLEIYNEVINDLLDPIGQNLRIREDSQGTYVEGIKEEVVLSPAHALSLIASGEEHRHVGSNNFNLLSSRSHTIFTLTIESSPSGENEGEDDVTLSQLNLIDLAGSESSKSETTGLRRKEGSYINKSLLTLGTVIAKLTDGKATHIPYRDSKLTRLLQSSLSGHGRVSLICTVTPASSNSEETHNTLKFAHRSKYVEIKASQNKIMDEKSLIRKYQREISSLKDELQQLKRGMTEKPYFIDSNQEDLVNLKLQLKLEAGQVIFQSRLEEEEQAKAALMGRIQRLTKLILVSTKNTVSSNISEKADNRRRHSFCEDELAYLPDRKREYIIDDDAGSLNSDFSAEGRFDANSVDESMKFDKRSQRRGMLGWFKLRKPEHLSGLSPTADTESSASGSPSCSQSSKQKLTLNDIKDCRRKSMNKKVDDPSSLIDSFPQRTQAGDLFSITADGRCPPPTGTTIIDQMDLLLEQVKVLAGEVGSCTSSLKRLSEHAVSNHEDLHIQEQMQKLKDEINEKRLQMCVLEQRMLGSFELSPTSSGLSQALSKLTTQLNEKTFELEIMSADNRILQEQLQMKISENAEIKETVASLRQRFSSLSDTVSKSRGSITRNDLAEFSAKNSGYTDKGVSYLEIVDQEVTPSKILGLQNVPLNVMSMGCDSIDLFLKTQVLTQAAEIENLKQEKVRLAEEKDGLEIRSQNLFEEASYAKELAAAAAVELQNLAEEVTKLSYQNAKLSGDLAAIKEEAFGRTNNKQGHTQFERKQDKSSNLRTDVCLKKPDDAVLAELEKELVAKSQREASLEVALSEKVQREVELQNQINGAKQREQDLENELANLWDLVAKIKSGRVSGEPLLEGLNHFEFQPRPIGCFPSRGCNSTKFGEDKLFKVMNTDSPSSLNEVRAAYEHESRQRKELEDTVSKLKGEDLSGLDIRTLEELQSFHVEALSKICQEKMTTRVL